MRIIVEENSSENSKIDFAIRTALRNSYEKGFPVWLSLGGIEHKVLPWCNNAEIEAKVKGRNYG